MLARVPSELRKPLIRLLCEALMLGCKVTTGVSEWSEIAMISVLWWPEAEDSRNWWGQDLGVTFVAAATEPWMLDKIRAGMNSRAAQFVAGGEA